MSSFRQMSRLLCLALLAGCRGDALTTPEAPPVADPAVRARLLGALGMDALTRAPPDVREGRVVRREGYTVTPVSLQVFDGFRVSAALWLPSGAGPHPGVLMAHGHFGQGKSSGEAQGPAGALAARGYAVLAVDTPGVEEGRSAGRQIHMQRGAHNRALLVAAGSSAMAAQLHGLQAGLDYLEGRADVGAVAVTGASGGAVQAFYLLFVDPRPAGAALASFVPMPREARAGGCACDVLPGWPGPDPALIAAAPKPTLWLSENPDSPPDGLQAHAGSGAIYRAVPGPHGYEPAMVREAAAWLDRLLAHTPRTEVIPDPLPSMPMEQLSSPGVGEAGFAGLLAEVAAPPAWTPAPTPDVPYALDCVGEGAPVILAGGDAADRAALTMAGFQPCALSVGEDELAEPEAIATGGAYADRFAGALRAAAAEKGAGEQERARVYAVRAWGVAAEGAGVSYVLRDPLQSAAAVDPLRDPSWVHAPGIWWGPRYASALAAGDDRVALVEAL